MKDYDPLSAPDPQQWLSLDEQSRLDLVAAYHRGAGERLPNPALHAGFHVVVENQLAQGLPDVTRTLARLMEEGLDRHDALHAIGSVLARNLHTALQGKSGPEEMNRAYFHGLRGLTAEGWRSSAGDEE